MAEPSLTLSAVHSEQVQRTVSTHSQRWTPPQFTFSAYSNPVRMRKNSVAVAQLLRGGQLSNNKDYYDQSWTQVGQNLQNMDRLYGASFSQWIKSPDNIQLAALHLRRITADYDDKRVIHGLRWLIREWTLADIVRFIKHMYTDDLWTEADAQTVNTPEVKKLDESTPLFLDPDVGAQHDPCCTQLLASLTGKVAITNTSDNRLMLDGIQYKLSEKEILRRIRHINGIMDGWETKYIVSLIQFVSRHWSKAQIYFYVERVVDGYKLSAINEFTQIMGPLLDLPFRARLFKATVKTGVYQAPKPSNNASYVTGEVFAKGHHRRSSSYLASVPENSVLLPGRSCAACGSALEQTNSSATKGLSQKMPASGSPSCSQSAVSEKDLEVRECDSSVKRRASVLSLTTDGDAMEIDEPVNI